ncbi:MAG: hypothetical protein AAF687_13015 [Pseudomonadota bacterium]
MLPLIALAQPLSAQDDAGTDIDADADFDYPIMISSTDRGSSQVDLRRTHKASPAIVPLTGAGKFTFPLDASLLPIGTWRPPAPIELSGRFWFDGEGRGVACEDFGISAGWAMLGDGFDGFDSKAFRAALCAQFKSKARFELADWYGGTVERGYVNVKIEVRLEYALEEPVRLASRENGTGHQLRILNAKRKNSDEDDLRCIFENPVQRDKRRRVCDIVLGSIPAKKPIAPGKSKSFAVYIPTKETPPIATGRVRIDRDKGPLRPNYVVPSKDGLSFLEKGEFELDLQFQIDDNPLWRWELNPSWEGKVSIQLEIHPDGRIKRCVPVRTSGNALVDNGTCAAAVKRGRVEFLGREPDGPVYYRTAVTWRPE